MECNICLEAFDHKQRVSKVAACGHTCCLECLKRIQRRECLQCRADQSAVQDHPPAAARPPAAALHPPPAAARPPASALDPPPAAARPTAAALDPPPAETPPPREMNVDNLRWYGPGTRQEEKAAALQQAQGVVRLVQVWCRSDPAWSLQLLQRAAPTVERLEVFSPRQDHLHAVLDMPRLQRLRVVCAYGAPQPPELGALSPGHSGLRWLRVWHLPRATLKSLLQAHAGTLEKLVLLVGLPGKREWAWSCSDLHSLLQQCGLQALRRLVLERYCSHTDTVCGEQRAAVQEALALPGLQVLCRECDHVQEEDP